MAVRTVRAWGRDREKPGGQLPRTGAPDWRWQEQAAGPLPVSGEIVNVGRPCAGGLTTGFAGRKHHWTHMRILAVGIAALANGMLHTHVGTINLTRPRGVKTRDRTRLGGSSFAFGLGLAFRSSLGCWHICTGRRSRRGVTGVDTLARVQLARPRRRLRHTRRFRAGLQQRGHVVSAEPDLI